MSDSKLLLYSCIMHKLKSIRVAACYIIIHYYQKIRVQRNLHRLYIIQASRSVQVSVCDFIEAKRCVVLWWHTRAVIYIYKSESSKAFVINCLKLLGVVYIKIKMGCEAVSLRPIRVVLHLGKMKRIVYQIGDTYIAFK